MLAVLSASHTNLIQMYPPLFCLFKPLVSLYAFPSQTLTLATALLMLTLFYLYNLSEVLLMILNLISTVSPRIWYEQSCLVNWKACWTQTQSLGFAILDSSPFLSLPQLELRRMRLRERWWLAKIKQEVTVELGSETGPFEMVGLKTKPLWVATMNLPHVALSLPTFSSSSRCLICYKVPAPSFKIRALPLTPGSSSTMPPYLVFSSYIALACLLLVWPILTSLPHLSLGVSSWGTSSGKPFLSRNWWLIHRFSGLD